MEKNELYEQNYEKDENKHEKNDEQNNKNEPNSDDDVNVLSGDNDIDVGIKPDVKNNDIKIQLCSLSLSFVFSCFDRKSDKNI